MERIFRVQRAKLVGGARIKLHITIHQREEKQEKETTTVQSARANKKLKKWDWVRIR